jgi:hypothetical protein
LEPRQCEKTTGAREAHEKHGGAYFYKTHGGAELDLFLI